MPGKATFFKEGVYTEHILGRVVKFNSGRQSLMRVESVERDPFGKRLYGINIMGNHHAAYAHDCVKATAEDMEIWHATQGDRNYDQYSFEGVRKAHA